MSLEETAGSNANGSDVADSEASQIHSASGGDETREASAMSLDSTVRSFAVVLLLSNISKLHIFFIHLPDSFKMLKRALIWLKL